MVTTTVNEDERDKNQRRGDDTLHGAYLAVLLSQHYFNCIPNDFSCIPIYINLIVSIEYLYINILCVQKHDDFNCIPILEHKDYNCFYA